MSGDIDLIRFCESYLLTRDYKAAIELMREILSRRPTYVPALHNLKYALIQQGKAKTKTRCGYCNVEFKTDVYPSNSPSDRIMKATIAIMYAELPDSVRMVQCPSCKKDIHVMFVLCSRCMNGYVSHSHLNLGKNEQTGRLNIMQQMWGCEECNYSSTKAENKSSSELRVYEDLLQLRPEVKGMVEVILQQEEQYKQRKKE